MGIVRNRRRKFKDRRPVCYTASAYIKVPGGDWQLVSDSRWTRSGRPTIMLQAPVPNTEFTGVSLEEREPTPSDSFSVTIDGHNLEDGRGVFLKDPGKGLMVISNEAAKYTLLKYSGKFFEDGQHKRKR